MSFGEDFRALLLAQNNIAAVVGPNVHIGSVPQEIEPPYIYLQRSGVTHERTLDQAQGETPFEERWDLECISDAPQELATLAEAVRGIDCARTTFGAGTMQSLFLEDQSDDYIPKGIFSDNGLDAASFQVTVYGYAPGT